MTLHKALQCLVADPRNQLLGETQRQLGPGHEGIHDNAGFAEPRERLLVGSIVEIGAVIGRRNADRALGSELHDRADHFARNSRPRTDGGLLANGLWSFASGVDFADWNNMQVFVPPATGEGPPEHRFALVPKTDYEIVDDWFSPGLAGTGSRSIKLDNVFIPEHRTIPSTELMGGPSPGSAINPGPLYRVPPLTLGTKVFSSPALGIAKGALSLIEDDIRARNTVGQAPMSELPTAQVRVAEAGAEIEAAEALLLKDCADAMATAEAGGVPVLDDRARWRRNNAFAVQLCVRAVERLNPLVGARGLTPENDFLRMFRDVHAASLQITVSWDIQSVNAGRIRFGLPSLDPRV